jgi:hypothetical protein
MDSLDSTILEAGLKNGSIMVEFTGGDDEWWNLSTEWKLM